MSIFTGRELEFLDSLRTSWPRLYRNELARLRNEDDGRREAQAEAQAAGGLHSARGGKILAFAPPCPRKLTPE